MSEAKLIERVRRNWCERFNRHNWQKISFGKRGCIKCGRLQWVFENPYPGFDESKYNWRDMGFIDPAALRQQEEGQ